MRHKETPLEMPLLPLWVLDTLELFNDAERTNLLLMMKEYWESGIELKPVGNERYPWSAIRMWLDQEKNRPERIRASAEYNEWRMSVFERDGYRCQICGAVGGMLQAHHIKKFSQYPSLRLNVDNGVTLCRECHIMVHRAKKE